MLRKAIIFCCCHESALTIHKIIIQFFKKRCKLMNVSEVNKFILNIKTEFKLSK